MTEHAAARRSFALAVIMAAAALASPAAAYEDAPVADAGTLTGTVRFVGRLATVRHPAVPSDDRALLAGRDECADATPAASLVVGLDRGVRDAVVLVQGVTRGKRAPAEVTLDHAACRFVPRVAIAPVGARMRVKNSDGLLHNPRGLIGARIAFNVALPRKEQVVDITRRLLAPAVVRLACGAHPHMHGWLVVHDSPYAAVTDAGGAYRIDAIPPGTWEVTLWHEGASRRDEAGRQPGNRGSIGVTRTVTIQPKTAATLDFDVNPRVAGRRQR